MAYAAIGSTWVSGFFKDVTRWDGAITGTEYISSAEEISITISEPFTEDDTIIVRVTIEFADTEKAPFNCLEELALGNVILTDNTGKEIPLPENTSEPIYSDIISGTAQLQLTLAANQLENNAEYTLQFESLYGSSKGDAPLLIQGNWNCVLKQ